MGEYRVLDSGEMDAAISLWNEVFGVERQFFTSLLDGGDPDDVSVGAFVDGRLVSSVQVFIRWFRDRGGKPLKVGGIGSVSTHPEFRSQGHSARLLDLAIEQMAARECVWSYLGTGINRHYARHGWRSTSTPAFRAKLAASSGKVDLEPVDVTDALLAEMASLHAEATEKQPMANARAPRMWSHSVRYRVTRPNDEVYVLREGGNLAAYLVTSREDDTLALVEGIGPRVDELTRLCLALDVHQGIRTVGSSVPIESEIVPVLQSAAKEMWPVEDTGWMARPIAGRIAWLDLAAILADPRGRRSELDNF